MIFGGDNRSIVSSFESVYPTVTHILVYFPDGTESHGSGIMVGPNSVLTAGHMLYSDEHGGYARSVEVSPARYGQYKPYGTVGALSLSVSQEWIANGNYDGDYGVIKLDSSVGNYTGYAEVTAYPTQIIGATLHGYGYPGDIADGTQMYETSGSVDRVSENELEFTDDFDAKSGQSGSGVLYNFDQGSKVVGVVSYESFGHGNNYNAVLGFDSQIASNINSFIAQNSLDAKTLVHTDSSLKPVIDQINMMYLSFLERNGDKDGVNYILQTYQNGASIREIIDIFYNSEEYQASDWAKYDNNTFLKYVFEDVLHTGYTQSDFNYWLNILDTANNIDQTRGDVLFLCSTLEIFKSRHSLDVYSNWHRQFNSWELEANGNNESEILSAATGDSLLIGYGGHDSLFGGSGEDYLWGGSGMDILSGGEGSDFFAFGSEDEIDEVIDFSIAEDIVRVRGDIGWSFGVSSDGYLEIIADNGSDGIVLVGVDPFLSGYVKIVSGELL